MFIKQIETIITDTIGMDSKHFRSVSWNKKIDERMQFNHCKTHEEYFHLLQNSGAELQELIELIIVPETWFFRDKPTFDFLNSYLANQRSGYVRILSVPCATGEEPYSIAMILIDLDMPADNILIDAIDISQNNLKKAVKGVFSKNSFRGKNTNFQKHYFKKENEHTWRISPQIKKLVHFSHGNLCSPDFVKGKMPYDVIFCRNLLIYMTDLAQKQTFDNITQLLNPNGLLFLGNAETSYAKDYPIFEYFGNLDASCLKKKDLNKKPAAVNKILPLPKFDSSKEIPPQELTLEHAKRLALSGDFEQAKIICLSLLQSDKLNPEIYYLLGVIYNAKQEDEQAESFFLRTLEIKEDHKEALVNLAILYDKQGKILQANTFRRKAQDLVLRGMQ